MRLTPLLVGCLLWLASAANAAAPSTVTATDMNLGSNSGSCNCSNRSGSSAHDSNAGNTDPLTSSHVSGVGSTPSAPRRSSGVSSNGDSLHLSSSTDSDDTPQSSGLGWQSLLPGSIQ